MAILRTKEARELNPAERKEKLEELQAALMEERSKLRSTGIADKPGRLSEIRRTIARLKTIGRDMK